MDNYGWKVGFWTAAAIAVGMIAITLTTINGYGKALDDLANCTPRINIGSEYKPPSRKDGKLDKNEWDEKAGRIEFLEGQSDSFKKSIEFLNSQLNSCKKESE